MIYECYIVGGELYHHGVLGQKWGKRNGPPYPLGPSDHSVSEKKAGYKKSIGGGRNEDLYERNREKSNKLNKNDLNKQGSNNKKRKTYTDVLTKNYMDYGLSEKEAREAAERKMKIIKGVAIGTAVVGLTVAGAVAYKKLGQEYFGRTILKGTKTHTLSMDKNRIDNGKAFFAAYKDGDIAKYMAMFGKDGMGTLKEGSGELKYDLIAKADKNLKIASRKHGIETLKEMFNDKTMTDDERSRFISEIKSIASPPGVRLFNKKTYDIPSNRIDDVFSKGIGALTDKDWKNLYTRYNENLVNHDITSREIFYKKLKNKGFSGVLDFNDIELSGFNTKSPVILFDTGNLKKVSDNKLTEKQVNKATTKAFAQHLGEVGKTSLSDPTNQLNILSGAMFAGIATNYKYDEKQRTKGYLKLSRAEREKKIEDYAKKYIKEKDYLSITAYNNAIESYVNRQMKIYDKLEKKKAA